MNTIKQTQVQNHSGAHNSKDLEINGQRVVVVQGPLDGLQQYDQIASVQAGNIHFVGSHQASPNQLGSDSEMLVKQAPKS